MKLLRLILVALVLAIPLHAQTLEQATSLLDDGKTAEAEKVLTAVWKSNKSAAVAYQLGRAAEQKRDLGKAEEWYAKAVELSPKVSEYHFALGRMYGQQAMSANILKQASLARKTRSEFEKAVELDGNNLDARFGLIDFYLMAPGIMGGSEEKAAEQAKEIQKRDLLKGARAVARVHQHRKETAAAEKIYRQAIASHPNELEPRLWLVTFLQQDERWDDAFRELDSALKVFPDKMPLHYQLGRSAAISGRHLDQGEASLRKYLSHKPMKDEPPLAWAHYRLGMVVEKKGQKPQAKQHYQEALKLEPELKGAREALKKL
jgi:tetratricopeptide (TPR) repeat protein